ncbi:hypothetical protein H4219_005025 [Mycoemilia scoparia]|uniref:NADH dehydrogenase [ubiquinone] 1 beta subcomplex subunit 8, mitochondrial n=1 Tax=Mycoemilia scoparia TaxID=417184 RepID=A0A9W7ZUF7_9FUNG|nr:hypothetical protein H4219_005025 [Mycoemilia scoparia]
MFRNLRNPVTATRAVRCYKFSQGLIWNPNSSSSIGKVVAVRQFSSKFKEEPYVDPDPQIGKYPNLPHVNAQTRPQLGWWDRQMRRNFGEPLHEHDERFNMWSPTNYPSPGLANSFKQWAVAIAVAASAFTLISFTRPEAPFVPRHFPYNGLADELGGHKQITYEELTKNSE